jgi:hypothetical protein
VNDDSARTTSVDDQLEAIDSLSQTLDAAGIAFWLFGGWAVDFWVGDVTRPHDDIDVVAWQQDFDAIRSSLLAAGWEHTPTADDVVGTRYRSGTARVEFTFVDLGADGQVIVPLPTGPITWSSQPFGDDRARLRGIASRVIPLAVLTAGKSVPREGAAEAAKDRADYDALSQIGNRA